MAKKDKKPKAEETLAPLPAAPSLADRAPKVPVALRFDGDLLARIDSVAVKRGMSRNALISYWCSRALEGE
jgi:hypothetical protein